MLGAGTRRSLLRRARAWPGEGGLRATTSGERARRRGARPSAAGAGGVRGWRLGAEGFRRRVGLSFLWLRRPPAPGHERSGLGKGSEAEGFRGEEPKLGRGWRTLSSRIPEELAFTFLSPFSFYLFMYEGGQEGSGVSVWLVLGFFFNSRDTNCPVPGRSSESEI